MSDKEEILKEKVEHNGLIDFSSFYSFAHAWFKEEGYGVNEEKYSEKTGDKRELDIEWKAHKDLGDYFRFEMKLRFEVRAMSDVEVEIDGQKRMMNKGKVSVEITGTLVYDKNGKWDTSPFVRFMRDIYNKYVIPSRVDDMQLLLISKVQDFKEELKAFLDLAGRR